MSALDCLKNNVEAVKRLTSFLGGGGWQCRDVTEVGTAVGHCHSKGSGVRAHVLIVVTFSAHRLNGKAPFAI